MTRHQSQRSIYLCSFCGKSQDQVQRLIAGPGSVFICNKCIDAVAQDAYRESNTQAERCSFCSKNRQQIEQITPGPADVAICSECIELCQEIIKEE